MKIRDLIAKRQGLHSQAKEILALADKEKRGLTDEERTNHDKYVDEIEKLGEDMKRVERLSALGLDEAEPTDPNEPPTTRTGKERKDIRAIDDEKAFGRYAVNRDAVRAQFGEEGDAVVALMEKRSSPDYVDRARRYLMGDSSEKRALAAGSAGGGGFTVMPLQFVQGLLKFLDDMVFIRSKATVHTVPKAEALGIMTMETDFDDLDWTSELGTGNEDDEEPFGRREMRPHPLAKRIKVSRKLMRQSTLGIEGIVTQRIGYKRGLTEEKAFLTGDGVQKPLGIFTAHADGIPTSRDVATDNTSTAITFDGLINAKYSLKGPYQAKATWGFHRDAVKMIAKLKDLEGRYVWEPSKVVGDPDRILALPYFMSEHIPNTFTTGLYVGFLGDLSFYHIADALQLEIQRLEELYAATNQTGFISRSETDAQPVLGEAFARVKLG